MSQPTEKLHQINDPYLQSLRYNWYHNSQQPVEKSQFEQAASDWFLSSKINNLNGTDQFAYIDTILGCTHYIDSLLIKHGRNIQVLPGDYRYYSYMGIPHTEPGNLVPGVPLVVSLPNWFYTDIRPDWFQVLLECESKNIDIHIDMAWMPVCRDINLNLDHPCIKSFAMSLSKYSMEWNRIGLRWSRSRTMDSITVFNHYQGDVNQSVISCGYYIVNNLARDYAWDTYRSKHFSVCQEHNLEPSRAIHVAYQGSTPVGIAGLLVQ
jgi:hypothetical protein